MRKQNNRHRVRLILLATGGGFFVMVMLLWQARNKHGSSPFPSALKDQAACLQGVGPIHEKQKGAHVFGIFDTANVQFLHRNNIEWVTVVSWAYQEDIHSPIVRHHNGDSLMIQRSDSIWLHQLSLIRSAGFNIFVKPHIWLDEPAPGNWRSDIFPRNKEDWDLWKKSYSEFILRYAHLAQQAGAEMFCIGTELSRLSVEKPLFWRTLIQKVRKIYPGKITYAANWYQEFEDISFWDKLDYIGIQAYFPLVKNESPNLQEISEGWNQHLPSLKSVHSTFNRKIIFTEMGYKSTADAAIRPWEWLENISHQNPSFSPQTQANCYAAFFNRIWREDWFAGVHIWQLRSDVKEEDRTRNLDFSPQGKPAEHIIAEGFE